MKNLKAFASFFKALGDETRLNIVDLLMKKNELSISDIAKAVGKEQSTVYRHIEVLERVGVVKSAKNDKFLMCCLANCRKLKTFSEFIERCRKEK